MILLIQINNAPILKRVNFPFSKEGNFPYFESGNFSLPSKSFLPRLSCNLLFS